MPLIELWKNSQEQFLGMNIEQIVKTAGDGSLKDNSETSKELREYLAQVDIQTLQKYSKQCLT